MTNENPLVRTDDPAPTGACGVLQVPARTIRVPDFLSPEARAVLSAPRYDVQPWPPPEDVHGWRERLTQAAAGFVPIVLDQASKVAAELAEVDLDGTPTFVITPDGLPDRDSRVYLDIHGGALVTGGGAACGAMGTITAGRLGLRTFAPDYRLPPDHPYPAPLDDCLAVYQALLRDHRPEDIIVGGGSAGGNLAAALILRARDEGLPLPAAAVLLTPELDLTESGDTFQTLLGVDTVLTQSLLNANLLYAGGHDLTDPYVSPLFGDFTKGFPPTVLASGTRDLFLSNTVRMHRALRRAGLEAELHVCEAAPHGGFGGAPEDVDLYREIRRFLSAHRPTGSASTERR